jgi:queuine/archaeosine tRNA-ribosyltransferase
MESTKKLYIGWSPCRGNPRIWESLSVPDLMINAFDFWDRNHPIRAAKVMLKFNGEIFCDSGGYQILSGRRDISAQEVIHLQAQMGAGLNAVLDNALNNRQHIKNLETYLTYSQKNPALQFVPVVPHTLPKKYIRVMAEMFPHPPLIAIGNVVPSLYPLSNHANLISVLRNIQSIKEMFPKSRIHVFGLGGVTTAALFFYLIDSTDSTAWVHDARFGKLRILGGGIARATRPKSIATFLKNNSCLCPACSKHGKNLVVARGSIATQLRAIHNAWVLLKELKLLNRSFRDGNYDEYIARRVQASPWHRNLFHTVRGIASNGNG